MKRNINQESINMIKSFTKNGKNYYCKQVNWSWSQWACKHEDGLETWAAVYVKNPTRQNVIDAINNVDN